MTQSDKTYAQSIGQPETVGSAVLARSAVTAVNSRQRQSASGVRQFILDHLLRAVLAQGARPFYVDCLLEELRGYRISLDSVIDAYVPAAARTLGEMWLSNEADFATVTIASMRLQSLLSTASVESLDFLRPVESSTSVLVVLPEHEQHTLGAFVVAAQLRRAGVRVQTSFCETPSDLLSRVICDPPDMIMFSCSSPGRLESVSRSVLEISQVLTTLPVMVLGGIIGVSPERASELASVDLVTNKTRDALALLARRKSASPDRAR